MKTKKLTFVIEKNLVTVVERQTKVDNFRFESLEEARSWTDMVAKLRDDSWEVVIR